MENKNKILDLEVPNEEYFEKHALEIARTMNPYSQDMLNDLEEVSENKPDADISLPVTPEKFHPMSAQDIINVLDETIKKDDINKVLAFLTLLSAYTEDSQLNAAFVAPSSTGKSYIPTQIARLFPEEDVKEVAYCSPTAFFHDKAEYIKETNELVVDLSRKILIFLDQPHTLLLQHLRPLLSHDKKEICLKITDKSQRAGLRTKNVRLIGYPAVVFCTAGLQIDEQEATRFLLLSPEINQAKIKSAIKEKIKRTSNTEQYFKQLDANPVRQLLKTRLQAIKAEFVSNIIIPDPESIEIRFLDGVGVLKPRHQRDIGYLTSFIKLFALLNLWFRKRNGQSVIVNEDDIEEGFALWGMISESQDLNLPPYVYRFYEDIILPLFKVKDGVGLTRKDLVQKHHEAYGRLLPDWQLRQQILPLLETAGLIIQEPDPIDKRQHLIYPTTPLTISNQQNNSESGGGGTNLVEEEGFIDQIEMEMKAS